MTPRMHRMMTLGALMWGLAGCGGPPTEQLNAASTALNGAALAKKCAPEEYEAAEKMLARAKTLSDEGKHDEAKSAALAAKKLADKAQQKALLRREECLNPKPATAYDPNDLVEVDAGPRTELSAQEGLKTIYFDFNVADLNAEAREVLARNANWMRSNAEQRVVIEGHCDSRGSTEYNLALGERRGLIVRSYLGQLGIGVDRLEVVSYGEEQPLDYGSNEAAFSRNRRAEFRTR